jgi:hypothetical protein
MPQARANKPETNLNIDDGFVPNEACQSMYPPFRPE